jgi:hypothetical protein
MTRILTVQGPADPSPTHFGHTPPALVGPAGAPGPGRRMMLTRKIDCSPKERPS